MVGPEFDDPRRISANPAYRHLPCFATGMGHNGGSATRVPAGQTLAVRSAARRLGRDQRGPRFSYPPGSSAAFDI